ncbi:MAG: hypothetical protein WC971_06285 [Coriobacteriia bacterium]
MGETFKPGSRVELAGDACLITAGTFGLFTGLSLAIFSLGGLTPLGTAPKTPLEMFLMAAVAILSLAGTVVGPALTWVLHGRRIDRTVVLSALGGHFVGGNAIWIAAMLLVAVTSLAAKPFTSWEFAGPVAAAAIVAVAVLAFVVWLDIAAVRDLSPSRREHVRLDVARLASTVIIVVFAVVVVLAMRSNPENEAGAFILAAGVFAGAGMAVTDWIVKYLERRKAAGG